MKRLVAAICLVGALPAFGQDLREQLVAPLHEACTANVEEALMRVLHAKFTETIDSAKFCTCADDAIRKDSILDAVAKLPESRRAPSSGPAVALEGSYFVDGLQCYSKLAGWPDRPVADRKSRPLEELQFALEKRKGAMYRAYSAALKTNPTLAGKVVFEFAIEPDGQVSAVTVVSSNLADDKLLDELKSILQSLKFAAEPVSKLVTKYPIDFLPH
jgi:hypothetical protein